MKPKQRPVNFLPKPSGSVNVEVVELTGRNYANSKLDTIPFSPLTSVEELTSVGRTENDIELFRKQWEAISSHEYQDAGKFLIANISKLENPDLWPMLDNYVRQYFESAPGYQDFETLMKFIGPRIAMYWIRISHSHGMTQIIYDWLTENWSDCWEKLTPEDQRLVVKLIDERRKKAEIQYSTALEVCRSLKTEVHSIR